MLKNHYTYAKNLPQVSCQHRRFNYDQKHEDFKHIIFAYKTESKIKIMDSQLHLHERLFGKSNIRMQKRINNNGIKSAKVMLFVSPGARRQQK